MTSRFTAAPRSPPPPPPPEGPPWDLPVTEAPLAFVDLEMTGLDAARDRVIEVCIERVRGGETEARLHTLVCPEHFTAETAVGNTHVHGIDAAALRDAPSFSAIAAEVENVLAGAIVVAHGAAWDIAFLEAEMARAGRPMRFPHALDTLVLARRAFGLKSHSLAALRAHFGLETDRAHRADADVTALRAVWAKCLEVLDPRTAREAWDVRIAEKKAVDRIIVECTEALAAKQSLTVVYRPRGKAAETLVLMLTGVIAELDPPRIVGYQLPGRGRRDLRADRILRILRNERSDD